MRHLSLLAGATLLAAAGQATAATAVYNITLQLGTDLDPGTLFAEGTTSNNTQGSWTGQYFNPLTASNAVPSNFCGTAPTYSCAESNPDVTTPVTQVSTINFSGQLTLVDDATDTISFTVSQINASDRIRTGVNPSLGGAIGRTLSNWSKTALWDPTAVDPTLFGAESIPYIFTNVDLNAKTATGSGGYSTDTGSQSCDGAPLISAICTSINGANSTRDQQWSSGLDSTGRNATELFGIGTAISGGTGLTDISCTIVGTDPTSTVSCSGHYVIVSSVEHTGASADVVMKTPLSGFCKTGNKICTTTGSATIGAFQIQGTVVPAPAGIWLLGTGLLGLAVRARRRMKAA